MIEYYVIDGIQPEPWESPTAMVGRAKGGKLFARLITGQGQRSFQDSFKDAFDKLYPEVEMATEECRLDIYVWRNLPLHEGEKKKVRGHRADRTNLQKSIEDALQKRLYKNDVLCTTGETAVIQGPDVEPRIVIVFDREPCIALDYIICAADAIRDSRPASIGSERTAGDNRRGVGEVPF